MEILYSDLRIYPECRSSSLYKIVTTQTFVRMVLQALGILQEQLRYSRQKASGRVAHLASVWGKFEWGKFEERVEDESHKMPDGSVLNQEKKGEQQNKFPHKAP